MDKFEQSAYQERVNDSSVTELTAKPIRRKSRWWRWTLIILAILIGGPYLAYYGLNVYFALTAVDAPPADDAFMLPVATPGGGLRNPLVVFLEEIRSQPSYPNLTDDVRQVRPGHEAEAGAVLEKWASSFQSFHRLTDTDTATWRWPGTLVEKTRFDTPKPYLTSCQTLANMVKLRVSWLRQEGHPEEAAHEAIRLSRFGKGIVEAQGGEIDWLVGITINVLGGYCLRTALASTDLPSAVLDSLEMEFSHEEIDMMSYRFTKQLEYLSFRNMLDDFAAGKYSPEQLRNQPVPLTRFKKNRTLREFLAMHQPLMDALDRGSLSQSLKATDTFTQWEAAIDKRRPWLPLFLLLSDNAVGQLFLGLSVPVEKTIITKSLITIAYHREHVLMLALRRFELAEHRLPQKLEDLVPAYLPAIPSDPFDGLPMRWNAKTHIVYSVSENLKDDGGAIAGKPEKSLDLGEEYWWDAANHQ